MAQKTCGCCAGIESITPETIANRPGLPALSYRVGTHATFLATMKARLATLPVTPPANSETDSPAKQIYPLRLLTTRAADDPTIALLDGWATVADVLTFYQERIANEGYLRTATERRSVLELARLVGYALRPGVASTVYLAYTVDRMHTDPVVIDPGARVQSVPGPGELPQSFETSDRFEARAAWNTLKPRMTRPQTAASIRGETGGAGPRVYLQGINTNLRPNDPLLIDFGFGHPDPFRVTEVLPDAAADHTLVRLRTWGRGAISGRPSLSTAPLLADLRQLADRFRSTEADRSGVSRDSVMYQSVVTLLDETNERLRGQRAVTGLVADLQEMLLPRLQAEYQRAAERGYARLSEWMGALVAEVEAVVARATTRGDASVTPSTALPGLTAQRNGQQPEEFKSVLAGLVKPASVPPRNSLSLERSVEGAFQTGSDLGLQTVSAIRPELGDSLPLAVANTKVTPDNPIKVYVPRVKTAVYAYNAPQKPIYDETGRPTRYDEWPLTGSEELRVELLPLYEGLGVRLTYTTGVQTDQIILAPDFEGGDEGQLGPYSALARLRRTNETSSGVTQLEVELSGRDERLFRRYTFGDTAGNRVWVQIERPQETGAPIVREVAQGQSQRILTASNRIEISFLRLGGQRELQPTLVVVDEMLLPPDPLNVVALDTTYDQIAPGSWVAIQRADEPGPRIGRVVTAETVAKTDYNFPARVTELTLEEGQNWLRETDFLLSAVRGTTVFAQSEELPLAEEVIDTPICGGDDDLIELDGLYSGLESGRWLIVTGERTDIKDANGEVVPGLKFSELVMLNEVIHQVADASQPGDEDDEVYRRPARTGVLPGDKTHTFIRLARELAYCYERKQVTIYGNVVKATHGETRNEVLGSGDASKPFQSFALRQPPLTYVPAATPAGAESTLKVYINDVEWRETAALAALGPADHRFITRIDDDGKTTVIFGNGERGARLPTGAENVKAIYRSGIGKVGNVQAEQISQLATRPLGVQGVINPLRATGGADLESRDQARYNAPLAVMALDRLVSVQDYADFARTFAGVGKAAARRLSDGRRQFVHLTIAGADDIPIDRTSDLYQNLVRALRRYGDPDLPVQVDLRELKLIVISAGVRILPEYLWEPVVIKIRARLYETFHFDRRELGQDVLLSEVIRVIQTVEGVAYVDVNLLRGIPEKTLDEAEPGARRLLTPAEISERIRGPLPADPDGNVPEEPLPRIPVNLAAPQTGGRAGSGPAMIQPAQLAFLSPLVQDTLILNPI